MRPVLLAAIALLGAPLAAAALPAPIPVVAAAYAFTPAALVVPLGATVEWQSAQLLHSVTTADSLDEALEGRANDGANADDDPDTFSAPLRVGQPFAHRFERAGTFAYFCEPHFEHGMVALVVVVD